MKKFVFLFCVAFWGLALQSLAQLKVPVPSWEKFAIINTAGVNVRKAPNSNSPKLYSKDESWGHEINIEYSWTQRRGYTPHHLEVGTILPILKETDDWYLLYFDGYEDIYIMKKFCSVVTPLTAAFSIKESGMKQIIGSFNYIIGLYFFGSAVVEPYVRIGHIAAKKYIITADYGEAAVEFVNQFYDDELGYPNEDKIKEANLRKFIMSHRPESSNYDIWVKFPKKQGLVCYSFNPTTYKYEMKYETY